MHGGAKLFSFARAHRNMTNAKSTRLNRLYTKDNPSISYLGTGISPDAVSSMFQRCYEVVSDFPWRHLPPGNVPIYVDIPSLGVRGAVMVKFAPRPERHGLAIFPSSEHWQAWLKGLEIPRSRLYAWSRLILVFDEKAPLTQRQQQEIDHHAWPMPTFYHYPDWFAVDGQGQARSLSQVELEILEAATGTIAGCFYGEAKRNWIKVWEGISPRAEFRHRVLCHRRVVDVMTRSRPLKRKPFPWAELARWDQDRNKRYELRALHRALYKHFRNSHEGYGEGAGEHYIEKFLTLLHDNLDSSIAQLTPNQLEILITDEFFEVFKWNPEEKVQVMLAVLKRFFSYLQRNYRFDAGPFIERLGHRDFHRRLEAAWSPAA